LSLAVEYEGDDPKPLPNLKYKIEMGDSLIAPNPKGSGAIRDELIGQYRQAKARYLRAHQGGEKKKLEKEISGLKTQISLMTHGSSKVSGFDWAVEFAEVFADGGFDVVVANPPYVRMELFKGIKPTLKKNFPEVHSDRADLYCYFYGRALQLLRPSGMLAFISSNKWFRAKYGEKLRKHIAETCQVQSITDFGDLPVFQAATAYPMIFIAQKEQLASNSTIFTQVLSLEFPYPNVWATIREYGKTLPFTAINGSIWTLTNITSTNQLKKMAAVSIPLSQYVNGQIYAGIKTGLNQAFIISESTRLKLIKQDAKSIEIIKPLVVGRNIHKWYADNQDKYLIYTHHGINTIEYPAVSTYLYQYRQRLEQRASKQKWYELQQPQLRYISTFDKPKIVFPDIAKEPRFTIDVNEMYIEMTAFVIPTNDLYLLGVLNSTSVKEFFVEIGAQVRVGYLRFKRQYVEKIPIPNAPDTERETISKLVQKCLDAKGIGCEEWEKEIDDRVAALYGL